MSTLSVKLLLHLYVVLVYICSYDISSVMKAEGKGGRSDFTAFVEHSQFCLILSGR